MHTRARHLWAVQPTVSLWMVLVKPGRRLCTQKLAWIGLALFLYGAKQLTAACGVVVCRAQQRLARLVFLPALAQIGETRDGSVANALLSGPLRLSLSNSLDDREGALVADLLIAHSELAPVMRLSYHAPACPSATPMR